MQAAELYYRQLKEDEQFNQPQQGPGEASSGNGSGDGQFDSHEGWSDGESQGGQVPNEVVEEKLKNILRKAASDAVNKGNNWGTCSTEMRQKILSNIESKIDWRKVLRYFIKTSQRSDKTGTMRKINKRYAYIHPGRRQNRHANVLIAIDQSGSVDDGMLETFFSELNALSSIAEFTVLPFDHEVAEDKLYVWKKGTHKKTERVLCGGTCFNAPTKFANEHSKYDGLIILTDLCAPAPVPCKIQRMWVTTEEHAKQPYFQTNERIIAVPRRESK
jgi:predicted metal-dependent peptidase